MGGQATREGSQKMLLEVVSVIGVIVNSLFVAVTAGVLIVNMQQVKASQRQADSSEDQVRIMRKQTEASQDQLRISREQLQQSQKQVQETLDASVRPFLFPTTPLNVTVGSDGSSNFDFGQLDVNWTDDMEDELGRSPVLVLKNVGSGIALNIVALLAPPRPRDKEYLKTAPPVRYSIFDTALPPGGEAKQPHLTGGFVIGWDTIIGNDPRNTLVAPARLSPEEVINEHKYHVFARLTITYDDIFGTTYFTQWDFIDRGRGGPGRWASHARGKGQSIEALAH
jgi:hypothetical protein